MTINQSRDPAPGRAPRIGPLLAGTGVLALVMGGGMARGAVAFQGNYAVGLGNVSLASGNATDTFTVNTPTAVLNWTPSDTGGGSAPIVFLPQGSTGIFRNGAGVSGFTVLNTITPATASRPIEFDGHVVSELVDAAGNTTRGGNVWFYAPGGLIVGATGVFDVGSLILTPNTIDISAGLPDPTTGIHFAAAAGSTAAVTIRNGAQINESAPGSYLAIVAPRINQGGAVTVNGSVGYIAAQAVDLTINAGLFSIAASTAIGSSVESGGETTLVHTGRTTGPAATATGTPHIIYMTTIAQNDAVTMLVSGTVGYQAATDASQVDGAIVLAGNALPTTGAVPTLAAGPAAQAGNISIPSGSFSNPVYADANLGAFSAVAQSGGLAFRGLKIGQAATVALGAANRNTFTSNGDVLDDQTFGATPAVSGPFSVTVAAGSIFDVTGTLGLTSHGVVDAGGTYQGRANTISIDGSASVGTLALDASLAGGPRGTFSLVRGGDIAVDVGTSGRLTVLGAATITADAAAAAGEDAQTVSGGTVSIAADGGSASFRQGLTLSASAATPVAQTIASVVQKGGTASIDATDGGSVRVIGDVAVDASAAAIASPGHTQTAMGGTASITTSGGSMAFSGGNTVIDASARGGTAVGGTARTSASGGPTLAYAGDLMLDASATNGASASAAAQGGTATIADSGSGLSAAGATTLRAGGDASAATAATGAGTSALGGDARVTASGVAGATGTTPGAVTFGGLLQIDARALAYEGADGPTGSATGGTARIETTVAAAVGGGQVTLDGSALLDSSATANASGAGVIAKGGASAISADAGTIVLGDGGDSVEIAADARGGTATGGTATLAAADGTTITANGSPLSIHATGIAGASLTGTGGTITIATANDGTVNTLALGTVDAAADGTGGSALAQGGTGIGGTVALSAGSGSIRGTTLTLASAATGGASGRSTGGAAARAGSVSVTVDRTAAVTFQTASLTTSAQGGAGVAGGVGGAATGGTVTLAIDNAALTEGDWALASTSVGGAGGAAIATGASRNGGAGGAASDGVVTAQIAGGSADIASLSLRNDATGGRGGDGAGYVSANGVAANVDGGDGGAGGQTQASGRTALTVTGGSFTATTLALRSTMTGGRGGDGGAGYTAGGGAPARSGAGGDGGAATGGDVSLAASAGTVSIAGQAGAPAPTTTMISRGDGGDGGTGGAALGATGGATGAAGRQGAGAGGAVALTTDGAVTAMLADADLESGPSAGRAGAPGFVTIAANDTAGTAPATPLSFTSLTATTAGTPSTGRTLIIDSVAPIAVSGTTGLATSGELLFEASGRGDFSTGSLQVASAASVASTQTDATAGTFAISAGDAAIDTVAGGPIALTTLRTTTGGLDVAGGAFSADTLDIAGRLGGSVSGFTLGAVDAGAVDLSAIGSSTVGTVAASGDLVLATTGTNAALGATSLTSSGGSITLDATGDVTVPTLSAGDMVRLTSDGAAHLGTIAAGTAIAPGTTGTSPDPGSILLHTVQTLALDNALAPAGSIVLISEVGRVSAPALSSGAGDPIVLLAAGDVAVGGAINAGTAAAPGALTIGGPQAVSGLGRRPDISDVLARLGDHALTPNGGAVTLGDVTAGSATIAAGGSLRLASLDATSGDADLTATGDAALGAITAGRSISFVASTLRTGNVSGGDVSFHAGSIDTGDVTATGGTVDLTASTGDLAVGSVTAAGAVTLGAAHMLTLGSVDGTGIALGSADIAIAAGAAIGTARTVSVAFANTGTGRTAIGDDAGAATGDYALSAAELASAHAKTISVAGSGTDTLIGDLTLSGGALPPANLLGSGAGFTVTGSGAIRIVGAARFTGLAADDTVTLRSTGGDITGVLPAGSIALDDGNGQLAGTLALEADGVGGAGGTILFATPEVAAAVSAARDPGAINTALGNPGTLADPGGYLRADTVSATFGTAFYTQNSGASAAVADRAGVTAGVGGIHLVPTTTEAASPGRLVLNARLVRNATTLTGAQVLTALALQPTGFASGTTVNSCPLTASNCGGAITPAQMMTTALVQGIQPVQDVAAQVAAPTGLGNSAPYSFTTPILISTVGLAPFFATPQIDEPVTGVGNDDLWVGIGLGRELEPMGGVKKPDAPTK